MDNNMGCNVAQPPKPNSELEQLNKQIDANNEHLHQAVSRIDEILDNVLGSEPKNPSANKDQVSPGGKVYALRASIGSTKDITTRLEKLVDRMASL